MCSLHVGSSDLMTLSVSLSSVRQSDGLSPKLAPMTVNVLYVYVCYSASFPVIGASSSVSRLVTTSQSQPCSSLAPSLQSILMSMQMVGLGCFVFHHISPSPLSWSLILIGSLALR